MCIHFQFIHGFTSISLFVCSGQLMVNLIEKMSVSVRDINVADFGVG